VENAGKNKLSMTDFNGLQFESKPFIVSLQRSLFMITVDQQQISVAKKNFIYPKKTENEKSYFVFLLIFFFVKVFISTILILFSKFPKRVIAIVSGAFLISSFIDWYFPVYYLYRLVITMLVEYILIAIVGRKHISCYRLLFWC